MAIHHIVLLKFKQGVTSTDIENFRASQNSLPSRISAISSIVDGRKIKHPLDHDYDEGVIFVFKDEDALKEYVVHQAHREHQAYAAHYIQDNLIFDIYTEETSQVQV